MKSSKSSRAHRVLLIACFVVSASGLGLAQLPYIPPELYQEERRLQGNEISFCIWEPNVTSELDRAVAQSVADALILEASFYSYSPPSEMEDADFWNVVLVLLTEHCDVLAGFNLVRDAYPDWLIPSRAYYRAPFAFVAANEAYGSLSDVPPEGIIGSMLHTTADVQLSTYLRSLPADKKWRRFPYGSPDHLVRHVKEGVVQAGLLWTPQVMAVTDDDPAEHGLKVLPLTPLPAVHRQVGFVVRQSEKYLRTLLDGALTALIEEGAVTRLIEEHQSVGEAPPVE